MLSFIASHVIGGLALVLAGTAGEDRQRGDRRSFRETMLWAAGLAAFALILARFA
ncbi:hypothetical protein [Methylobacterium sp. WCS2018Hpa-22]|uniref:hypothetical protein n=1 Tax=Methylobacterium sp. WCS2018Hpa-22 TaxID=3073633 RepID=UPI00288A8FFF|nr:hypothetical protein [Methylobacterium sp. WCS2018Hpa-22]